MDETHSLQLALQPFSRLLELSRADAHPPGYFILLKSWLALCRRAGLEPSPGLARLPGLLPWVVVLATAWIGSRRFSRPPIQILFTLSLAVSAGLAFWVRNIRGYGFAMAALFVCFVVLWHLLSPGEQERRHRRTLWALYAMAASFSLWMHLLSAATLFWLGVAWLVTVARRRAWSSPLFVEGALANAAAIAFFSPWAWQLVHEVGRIATESQDWRTPRTVPNLLRVFFFWFPFGEMRLPGKGGYPLLMQGLGLLSILLPLGTAAWCIFRSRCLSRPFSGHGEPATLRRGALLGLGVSVATVLTLWTVDRFGYGRTFDGARYTVFSMPLWVTGLACLSIRAADAFPAAPRVLPYLLMAPWFAASFWGQARAARIEPIRQRGLALAASSAVTPPPGSTLYVMPTELIPYHAWWLENYRLRPIEELGTGAQTPGDTFVLHLTNWEITWKFRDRVISSLLRSGAASARVQWWDSHSWVPHRHRLYKLTGLHSHRVREAFDGPDMRLPGREIPVHALARALRENQSEFDGWELVSPSVPPETLRWGVGENSSIRFDRKVPAGSYRLHLAGNRAPLPRTSETLVLQLEGGDPVAVSLGPGEFHLQVPITHRADARPVLKVSHPAWRPSDHAPAADSRRLTFQFSHAWLEAL